MNITIVMNPLFTVSIRDDLSITDCRPTVVSGYTTSSTTTTY